MALNIPCSSKTICVDSPLAGISAEGVDGEIFVGEYFAQCPPSLGDPDLATACGIACRSFISQEDADLCAARLAAQCACGEACNEAQSHCVACPDGSEFCYTVPACTIFARTVLEANAIALSLAQIRANQVSICIYGSLPDTCLGEAYDGLLTVVGGNGSLSWFVVGGELPPGMTLVVANDGRQVTVTGTSTTTGSYEFSLRVVDQQGNFMVRNFQVSVVNITTSAVPAGVLGEVYNFAILASGGSTPYTFELAAGELPPGVTLNEDGTLTGTPTASGIYNFTVTITDSSA